jgi:tRNA(Leu) C34 or U34 (ribose-2'-O)-methylase TrmL
MANAGALPPMICRGTDILKLRVEGVPLIVVLDGIEDPHNVGAIIRTADAAGADGVVRQSRRAAALDGIAAKASAGAVAHVNIVEVVNIARAVEDLKALGVWTVGLDGTATGRYDEIDLTVPVALVFGAEGSGLRRLVRERCDFPPFKHAILVTVRSAHEARATFSAETLARRLKETLGSEFILGEATPAPLEKLQGQFRFHILMRGQAIVRLSRLVRETLDKLPFPEDVAVAVDVDPYQLL